MINSERQRRRTKLSATVDADLLASVDRFVAEHPDATRSSVIDEALRIWAACERSRAIEQQYAEDNQVPTHEWSSWVHIRDAAAKALGRNRG